MANLFTIEQQLAANLGNFIVLSDAFGTVTLPSVCPNTDNWLLNTQWPHRALLQPWLTAIANDADFVVEQSQELIEQLYQLPATIKIASLTQQPQFQAVLRQAGFVVSGQQCLMSKSLNFDACTFDKKTDESAAINLIHIENIAQRQEWLKVCSAAFGYTIDHEAITAAQQQSGISLWLAQADLRQGLEVVGTVLLCRNQFEVNNNMVSVLGIHQLGVAPAARRRGIAERIMQACISHAVEHKDSLITLQASSMAEPLYRRLGFVELGTLQWFTRINTAVQNHHTRS